MKDLKIRIPFTDEYIENFLLKNDIKVSTNSPSIEMILIYDSGKNNTKTLFDREIVDTNFFDIVQKNFYRGKIHRLWIINYQPNHGTFFHKDDVVNRVVCPIKNNNKSILYYDNYSKIEEWKLDLYKCYHIGKEPHKFFNNHETENRVALVFDYKHELII